MLVYVHECMHAHVAYTYSRDTGPRALVSPVHRTGNLHYQVTKPYSGLLAHSMGLKMNTNINSLGNCFKPKCIQYGSFRKFYEEDFVNDIALCQNI